MIADALHRLRDISREWRASAMAAGQYSVECAPSQESEHAATAQALGKCADDLDAVLTTLQGVPPTDYEVACCKACKSPVRWHLTRLLYDCTNCGRIDGSAMFVKRSEVEASFEVEPEDRFVALQGVQEPLFVCPVCEWPKLAEKPDHSYEICPSCGTEFGYDDEASTHAELRKQWIGRGRDWFSGATPKPSDWPPTARAPHSERTEPPIIDWRTPNDHDAQCEAESTSHGYTPCRCAERAAARAPQEPPAVPVELWNDFEMAVWGKTGNTLEATKAERIRRFFVKWMAQEARPAPVQNPRLIEQAVAISLMLAQAGFGEDIPIEEGVRQLIARPAPPLDWQPIATVPQDRRWVLVWQEDCDFSVYRFGPGLISEPDDVQWTHWAPIHPPAAVPPPIQESK